MTSGPQQRIPCPACTSKISSILDVQERQDGVVRRRRVCHGCKNKYTSYELNAEAYHRLLTDQRLLNHVRNVVRMDDLLIPPEETSTISTMTLEEIWKKERDA